MDQSKQTLRNSVYAKLTQLSPEAQNAHSAQVRDYLLGHDYIRQAHSICVYQASRDELSLRPFISTCKTHEKIIGMPRIESSHMEFRILNRDSKLEPHPTLDFFQPAAENLLIRKDEIDTILVPMVAYDAQLNRLGRGSGFYDRFLASVPDNTRVVGIAHSIQQLPMIPTERHDIPMDIIVTERGVLPSAAR